MCISKAWNPFKSPLARWKSGHCVTSGWQSTSKGPRAKRVDGIRPPRVDYLRRTERIFRATNRTGIPTVSARLSGELKRTPSEFPDAAWAEWEAKKQELFGLRWPQVQAVLGALEKSISRWWTYRPAISHLPINQLPMLLLDRSINCL